MMGAPPLFHSAPPYVSACGIKLYGRREHAVRRVGWQNPREGETRIPAPDSIDARGHRQGTDTGEPQVAG